MATTTGAAAAPFLAADLDEAAIYTKVLTAEQVKAHYEASPAATNDAPVAALHGHLHRWRLRLRLQHFG